MFLAGTGGTECVIACNGTEWTYESISEASKTVAGLKKSSDDPNLAVNDEEYLIAGGTIYILDNGERYIYFHQGQEYTKLPPQGTLTNKFGNWYHMKRTDD